MKVSILFFMIFSTGTALASQVSKSCEVSAEKLARKILVNEDYDQDGIVSNGCSIAANKQVILCEIAAMKGQGTASDTYLFVLNKKCSGVLRYERIGEE